MAGLSAMKFAVGLASALASAVAIASTEAQMPGPYVPQSSLVWLSNTKLAFLGHAEPAGGRVFIWDGKGTPRILSDSLVSGVSPLESGNPITTAILAFARNAPVLAPLVAGIENRLVVSKDRIRTMCFDGTDLHALTEDGVRVTAAGPEFTHFAHPMQLRSRLGSNEWLNRATCEVERRWPIPQKGVAINFRQEVAIEFPVASAGKVGTIKVRDRDWALLGTSKLSPVRPYVHTVQHTPFAEHGFFISYATLPLADRMVWLKTGELPAWHLSRNGKGREVRLPAGPWVERVGATQIHSTRSGYLVVNRADPMKRDLAPAPKAAMYHLQTSGGRMIEQGNVSFAEVSPDGRRVAYLHLALADGVSGKLKAAAPSLRVIDLE